MIYILPDRRPEISKSSYIAPSADIIGLVRIFDQVSVWFNVVIRGDNELIQIGNRSNVQDCSVLHTDPGMPLTLEDNVTVGHSCMLHGCRVKTGSLIGIGSVILNKAVIGENCLVGANALITENKKFPDQTLILGSPAKVARSLSDKEVDEIINIADIYVNRIQQYQNLKPYAD